MPYSTHIEQPHIEQHCHATGTMIDTETGPKPVETLAVGDRVRTKDNGFQPIRWIAGRTLSRADLAADPALRPVRIRAGALGDARPSCDLLVSQEHCVLLSDWRCALLFGEDEMLAPARALLNDHSITVEQDAGQVTFYHFMFDAHQIVYSNGVETESFHPAAGGLDSIDAAKRAELLRLFPDLALDAGAYGPQARATLCAHEVDLLMTL